MSRKLFHRKAHGAIFLDPESVGSSVRWTMDVRIESHRRKNATEDHTQATVEANVYLTDCDKTITWGGYESDEVGLRHMQTKVERAILQLREFSRALDIAHRAVRKHHTAPAKED